MKFSIRDLLLVTVIVALAVGWWVDRRRLSLHSRGILRQLLQEEEESRVYEAKVRELEGEKRRHYWGGGPVSDASSSTPNSPGE